MCQISHVLNRTGLVVCSIFSRKGARIARNFNVFLCLAPTLLRTLCLGEILYIFLSQRRQDRQELRCFFCAYPKHLCVLCALARFHSFFLSQRRQRRKELRCLICSYPKHLCVLCDLARFICFYLSQRRRGRREFQCLFSFCPKHLCVLCALARVYFFLSQRRRE